MKLARAVDWQATQHGSIRQLLFMKSTIEATANTKEAKVNEGCCTGCEEDMSAGQ